MSATFAKLGLAALCAAVTGYVFERVGVPAGWLLGALVAAAVVREFAGPLQFTGKLRRGGQLVVGAAVAGLVTPAVLDSLGGIILWVVAAAVASNLFCLAISVPAGRLAGIDRRTAALSCLPGGLSEMAPLARELGADDQAVTVFHTLRVTLIVVTVPFLLLALGFEGVDLPAAPATTTPFGWFPILLAVVSAPLASVASRFGVINPWVVTPIVLGVALVLAGVETGPMPPILTIAAQVVIGVALGSRLERERLTALPRVFAVGLGVSVVLVLTTLLVGAGVLPGLIGVSSGTGVVSMAPGGISEMIAVAKAMDLLPTTVATFGIVRSVLTNTVVSQLVTWIPADRPPPQSRK